MLNTHYLLLIPLLLFSSNVSANVMIPAFMLVWPLAWLAFIPIVFIEAFVMRRFLKQESSIRLLLFNTLSNAVSTFVGIPIAFLIAALFYVIPINALIVGPPSQLKTILFLTVLSLGILSLFPLFFFISVWIEKKMLSKLLHTKYETATITQAVRSANIASYIFLFIAYVIVWIGSYYYPDFFRIFSFW